MDMPAPLPKALETPATPELTVSPALSLKARPGEPGIRTRKVAVLVAPGVEAAPVQALQAALLAQGAVGRIVAPRLGLVPTVGGEKLQADATTENSPGFLFDALALPDGQAAEALAKDGHALEFIKDQYRHGKTIIAFGASQALLMKADIPLTLHDGSADPGLILGDAKDAKGAIDSFIAAMAMHRHPARETDPPLV